MVVHALISIILSAYLTAAGDYSSLFHGQVEPQFPFTEWATHPFWFDADYRRGDISFEGRLYEGVEMHYNVLDNALSVVSPNNRWPIVVDLDKVQYFVIDGFRYEPFQGRFACVAYEGAHLTLLHDRYKIRSTDVITDGRALHNMEEHDDYYLRLANDSLLRVKRYRSFVKAFPQYKRSLKRVHRDLRARWVKDRETAFLEYAQCLDSMYHVPSTMYNPDSVYMVNCTWNMVHSANERGSDGGLDSLIRSVAPVTRVSAYHAYRPGSTVRLEYTDDEDLVIEEPGVAELAPMREMRTLEEVEVVGFQEKVSQEQGGMESFRPSLLRNVPLAMGEADVLKLAMLLPGVTSTGEASSGLNVRGGSSEQNLMLYNGNTIFNPMHMFGLFSTFNPDLIAESDLFKGGIPSQYGGRLSSVMNIRGLQPSMTGIAGSASIGIVSSKAMIETPVVKNRASLLLGGRTTYSDWMLKRLPESSGYRDGRAGFWDLGGSLHLLLNRRHTLNLHGYRSHDRFSFTEHEKYQYGNQNYSAELKSLWSETLTSVITAGYDHYDYRNETTDNPYAASRLSFDLNQYFLKGVATYTLNESHKLNGGWQSQWYQISPGTYEPVGDMSFIVRSELADDKALEGALFVEDAWQLDERWKVVGGLRLNMLYAAKEGMEHFYMNPDVRLSGVCQLTDNRSVKVGVNSMHQYLHKVSNTVIMSPTDTWMLSNSKIRPQRGWQWSAGYFQQTPDMNYEFSAEAYFKTMNNYLTYRDAAILVMNPELHKDVVGTRGRAYGIELQLRKLHGKLNGWISYTYARTQLRQKGKDGVQAINRGEWFAADYDIPHQIKLVSNYKFTRRYSTSLNVDYSTGRPYTAPVGSYYSVEGDRVVPIYTDRNACRMPYYLRADWSFNIEPSHHITNLTHSWLTLGVYNVLGRKNPYSIYYESTGWSINGYKLSVFGAPIPYVTYNIKF